MRISLKIPLTNKDFIRCSHAFSRCENEEAFTHITTDSREALPGDLFFSFATDRESAREHVYMAREKGAKSVSSLIKEADFLVSDSEEALLNLAVFYKSKLKSLKATLAITGSVGKTTAKEFSWAVLSPFFKTHKTYMNFNNALGLSLSLLTAPADTEVLVLELGMNALGEIKRLSEAIMPDAAAITNIGTAHIGMLGTRNLIARAKSEISAGMTEELVIVPDGEPLLSDFKVKYSLSSPASDYFLNDLGDGNYAFFHRGKKIISFSTKYKAEHHLKALTIALAFANILSLSESEMALGIKAAEKLVLRQRLIDLKKFSVFDDTYSSSYEAVSADLDYLKLEYPNRAFSCALGDILELGQETVKIHRELGRLAYQRGAKRLFAFGSYSYLIREGALGAGMNKENVYVSTDLLNFRDIAKEIYNKSKDGEIVLIKASHALHAEKITEEIERLDK